MTPSSNPEPPTPTLPPLVPNTSPPQPTLDSTINLSISTVAEDVSDQLVVTSAGYHGSEDFIAERMASTLFDDLPEKTKADFDFWMHI